jgi:hypothetical protein
MKDLLGIEINFDLETDLSIGRKYLRALDQVPPSVWEGIAELVKNLARERATSIPRHSVSKKTQKWREWAAKTGKQVETHRGEKKSVLRGPRVGKRTSTFVDDLRESKAPGVKYGISSEGTDITNGTFDYRIAAEAFAYNYPGNKKGFLGYLIRRGIIPDGGYLELEPGMEEEILNMLEQRVSEYLGIEWVEAPWV